MPFWSRGSSEEKPEPKSYGDDFSSSVDSSFDSTSAPFSSSDDAMTQMSTGLGDMQNFSLALRQQMMVQAVINSLTDKAFEKCITGKPSDSLSGKEVACVNATVCKWLDTNEFMNGRMTRKMGGGGM